MVENLAADRWRMLRLWAIERSSLKDEMDKHDPAAHDPSTRAARAFRTLCDESHCLDLLNRYETRIDRQYFRSLNNLLKRRADNPIEKLPPEPNPISEHLEVR